MRLHYFATAATAYIETCSKYVLQLRYRLTNWLPLKSAIETGSSQLRIGPSTHTCTHTLVYKPDIICIQPQMWKTRVDFMNSKQTKKNIVSKASPTAAIIKNVANCKQWKQIKSKVFTKKWVKNLEFKNLVKSSLDRHQKPSLPSQNYLPVKDRQFGAVYYMHVYKFDIIYFLTLIWIGVDRINEYTEL